MTVPRIRRRQNLANRLKETREDGRRHCWVFQCPDPPGNSSGNGLGRYCRRHLEHLRRHGDVEKGSYKATRVAPYRKTAARWVKRNADDRHVKAALSKIEALKAGAGQAIPPRNLRGVSPADKARSVWARLRNRKVANEAMLSSILGVAMCHAADPQPGKREYLRVQIAKVLNRMAGGEVKRWATHYTDPRLPKEKVLKWFPASEGRVLHVLGREAEVAAEILIHDRMKALLAAHNEAKKKKAAHYLKNLPFPVQA